MPTEFWYSTRAACAKQGAHQELLAHAHLLPLVPAANTRAGTAFAQDANGSPATFPNFPAPLPARTGAHPHNAAQCKILLSAGEASGDMYAANLPQH